MSSTLKSVMKWPWGSNGQAPSQKDLCETCGMKPKFVENGFQHPYCSRTCARNGSGPKVPLCAVPNCRQAPKAAYGGCCSDEHFRDALRSGLVLACDQCRSMPQTIGKLCTACERRRRAIPLLKELVASSPTFTSISAEFSHQWRGAQPSSGVMKVIEVASSRETRAKFDEYRRKIDPTGKLPPLRTYHASQCICDFGVNDLKLCSWQSCGICSILKSSFSAFEFSAKQNAGKFGGGIYSYTNPALADKFATSSTSSPYRVMIACDVAIAGRNDNKQVVDGASVFVAASDAILPVFVILYTL